MGCAEGNGEDRFPATLPGFVFGHCMVDPQTIDVVLRDVHGFRPVFEVLRRNSDVPSSAATWH